jgi:putative membrane protein
MDRRFALLALAGAPFAASVGISPAKAQFFSAGMDQFRMQALQGGEFALQSSRLAAEKALSPRVRQFAELEANEQIAYAAALGAQPGMVQLRQDHAELIERLSAARGSTFDRLYIQGQAAGHQELLQINQTFAQGGTDVVGRAVAILAVSAIQSHLVMLSALRGGRARA